MSREVTTQPYLTVAEVAQMLGVTTRTVRNWIESKKLPAKRVGGIVRILEADLRNAIKSVR